MLDDLISFHNSLMATTDLTFKRYLYDAIHWDAKAICIIGARGVGKTTLLCQNLLERYKTVENALYISADNVHVAAKGLLNIASEYFSLGGKALFIDEVHKYPNWSQEIKNILDTYRKHQVVFSASSALELHQSKADLSRRVVYHSLPGLSFREYLLVKKIHKIKPITLTNLLCNHVAVSEELKGMPILKHFNNYLAHGYYPYFLEGIDDYLLKVNNVIEKVIIEDIAVIKSIKPVTIMVLKKILWLVATSTCLVPNVDNISKSMGVTRDIIYDSFEYLQQSGLIKTLYANVQGMKLVRKPGKIYLDNTNLLNAINGSIKTTSDTGSIRETFFANQLAVDHKINTYSTADFIVDEKYVFEVGGKNKTAAQIKSTANAYLAVDGIPIGLGHRIPLYLFGCLY